MKKVFILHLLPLEYYPPITNLLAILDLDKDISTQVCTTKNNKKRSNFEAETIPIYRTGYPGYAKSLLLKLWSFFMYVFLPLWRLLLFKPDVLIYYEPHSAMPAYVYKKFFNKKVRLFIHYHEYYASDDFKSPSMGSVRFSHKLEVAFLYKKAEWISQTNTDRLNFFSKDYAFISKPKLYTLANYPPKEWYRKLKQHKINKAPIKMLYLGALSFENTFIREIVKFVNENASMVSLDVFSYNTQRDVIAWFKALKTPNIKFNDSGVPYEDIPKIAVNYDIGLVLYKGHNTNYQFNAPNKLFEYLVCGLDVWVPNELKGCETYVNMESRPFVFAVNYNKLDSKILQYSQDKKDAAQREINYNAEDEYAKLITKIKC